MKKAAVAFALVLASIALVACGSSSGTTTESTAEGGAAAESGSTSGETEGKSASGAGAIEIEADPSGSLAYTTATTTAKAGNVNIDFNNPQPLEHDVAIEGSSGKTVGKTELVAEGSSSTVVNLKPGTYKFFCTVPGHREAGMEGTLTVK